MTGQPEAGAPASAAGGGASRLREKAARGVKWSLVQTAGSRGATFLVFLVLARLLSPRSFGLFTYAQAIVALLQALADTPLATIVVQRKSLDRDYLDALFWATMGASLGLSLLCFASSGAIGRGVEQPELPPLLRALSLSFLITGLSTVQMGLLRREFRFRSLAVRSLVGEASGGVVALVAAFLGAGVWSLVVQRLVASAVGSVVLWSTSTWRPSWRFPMRALRGSGRFAAGVTGSRMLWVITNRIDDFLIGTFLGPVALGFYTVGYRVTRILSQVFADTLIQVAVAAFARVQDDPVRLRSALTKALRLTGYVGIPVFLAVAMAAEPMVLTLFGPKWIASVPVMRVLALLGLTRSLQAHGEALLLAVGRPDLFVRLEVWRTLLMVLGFLLVVDHGILWVAVILVCAQYGVSPVLTVLVSRVTGVTVREIAAQYRPALIGGVCMVATMGIAQLLLGDAHAALRLVIQVAAGSAAYVAATWLSDRETVQAAGSFVRLSLVRR